MKKKILICDDYELIQDYLKYALDDHYDVTTVSSGEECLKTLRKEKNFELILLDINMPGIDGIDTLAKINNMSLNIPVIIITANQDSYFEDASKCLRASGFIKKPFTKEDILNLVNQKIEQ